MKNKGKEDSKEDLDKILHDLLQALLPAHHHHQTLHHMPLEDPSQEKEMIDPFHLIQSLVLILIILDQDQSQHISAGKLPIKKKIKK